MGLSWLGRVGWVGVGLVRWGGAELGDVHRGGMGWNGIGLDAYRTGRGRDGISMRPRWDRAMRCGAYIIRLDGWMRLSARVTEWNKVVGRGVIGWDRKECDRKG